MIQISDSACLLLWSLRDKSRFCSNRYQPASQLISEGLATGKPMAGNKEREISITESGRKYSEPVPAYPKSESEIES